MKADSLNRRLSALEPKPATVHDNWEEIRLAMLYALDDFPDAKMAVVAGIRADPNHGNMEWLELRTTILAALRPFPDALQSVIEALAEVGA